MRHLYRHEEESPERLVRTQELQVPLIRIWSRASPSASATIRRFRLQLCFQVERFVRSRPNHQRERNRFVMLCFRITTRVITTPSLTDGIVRKEAAAVAEGGSESKARGSLSSERQRVLTPTHHRGQGQY